LRGYLLEPTRRTSDEALVSFYEYEDVIRDKYILLSKYTGDLVEDNQVETDVRRDSWE
jgi:hypothetical protein